jgi:peptidoglycan hydrolase-like protein with peptidoglycan-binding domain
MSAAADNLAVLPGGQHFKVENGGKPLSDPWVTNTQNWLNSTYHGVIPGWEDVTVDGSSGWETVYGLIHALQWELGIAPVSDNFGPGTFAAVDNIAPIGNTLAKKNIIRIIQGGLYCKGYNGGDGQLDGVYSSLTYAAVSKLRTDIGLSASTGEMTPKVFKALLNMDAFVLVSGGSSQIRAIQRDLNARYLRARTSTSFRRTDSSRERYRTH